MQLAGLLLSFAVILFLAGRRVELGTTLLLGTAVLALASQMPLEELAAAVVAGLLDPRTLELVAGVAVITSLADVLRRFGLLETMVHSVTHLLGGPRQAIMAVPSIIGALPVVGGAILSAPMVDGLGQRLSLEPARKAAVNMVFRHAWYFIAPFAPSLVLASQMADIPLSSLILCQMPFALIMLVGGYFSLLRGATVKTTAGATVEAAEGTSDSTTASEIAAGQDAVPAGRTLVLRSFLRSASPIVVSIVLSLGLGPLKLPLWGAVGFGLLLALALSRGHAEVRLLGLPAAWAGVQWKTVYAMGAVMVFSRVLTGSGATTALVETLVASHLPLWVLMLAVPVGIGLIVGHPTIAVGIAYPTLLPMIADGRFLGAAAFLYSAGMVAYFVSPVHLCQILTSRFFGVTPTALYRQYRPVMAMMLVCLGGYLWWVVR